MNEIVTSDDMAASREVRTGFLSGPGFVDKPVRYSVVNGIALYQGCIDMGPAEEVETAAARLRPGEPADVGQPPSEMLGIGLPSDSDMLWTNGVVPFVVDAGLPNAARVTQAIAHIQDNTGIRFVARGSQANYVRFVRNPGQTWSSSPIGMRGGEQLIRLSDGATMGTTVHECLHSLGILHEQSRCDRDQFVTINYGNIQDGFESNFDRFCDGFTDYFDYDYDSIMHYGPTAFGVNGATTIVPLRPGVTIGQRNGLSFGDRVTIAHMYARFTGRGHTGVFRAGSGKHALWVNASWDSFAAKWQEWAAEGLRLIDINVRRVGNELRYSGVWTAGTGGYALWANASWDSFKAKWQEWAGQGLRLVDLHVLRVGNEDRYSGVWRAGTGGYALWVNASWDSFKAKWQEWAGQGLRLVDINVHEVGGQARYSGVWLAGSGGYALWANASWDSFKAKWQEWAGQGLRLVDLNVHQSGGDNRYSGVWLAGTDAYYLWANVPWESFRARWQQQSANGLRLIDYEFTEPAAADSLDFTGSPTEEAAPLPTGVGGLYDGETLTDLSDTAAADGTPMATDGAGGVETGTPSPAAASAGDGMGGMSGGTTAEPAAAAAGDGDGGLVTEGSQKTVALTVAGLGGTANGGDHPTKHTRKPKAVKH
ncbi:MULTISPECIES: M12 family metallopeptidase [unclassified Saccharothrix]|uniref:M12 family metallopeptidase n=1 Tax=unclassified Saccharothrix TaxID=2593673 RepID=UPI00307E802A